MAKLEREDIQIISRHSTWSKKQVAQILKEDIYNNKESWNKFLRLFFMSLGIGFTTAGIIFFFAYNWADLHKFIKLGLIEGLIIIVTAIILFSKLNSDVKNILLVGNAILVGVLFAVFGQIYQTGANAYDFFLGWALFISLWVAVSNFAPLWLLFIVLINTTFILYWQQVAMGWSEVFVFTILFLINSGLLITSFLLKKLIKDIEIPIWFSNILALAAVSYTTIGVIFGIFNPIEIPFYLLLLITVLLYGLGIKYALKYKNSFYIALISFSIIVIISAYLLNFSHDASMVFFISLFVIGSVTFIIKNLIDLQKKWIN
ncbi:MAG: DUF2157 domain-containing protein [Xanthomarina sp.]